MLGFFDNSLNKFNSKSRVTFKKRFSSPYLYFDKFVPIENMGKTPKSFLMCKGWYLRDMFLDLRKNPNNNYVTCIDKIIYDPDFSINDLFKANVSCIIKYNNFSKIDLKNKEYLCSKIANLFGVKTEYIFRDKSPYKKLAHIDFLSEHQKMVNFYDFTGVEFIKCNNLVYKDPVVKDWLEALDEPLNKKLSKLDVELAAQIKKNIYYDFIKQYLFKKYILRDSDCGVVNFSFVYARGDFSDLKLSPAYDYENCFERSLQGLEDDINYLYENYPDMLNSIIKSFLSVEKKDIKTLTDKLTYDPNEKKLRLNFLMEGLSSLEDKYNSISAKKCNTII